MLGTKLFWCTGPEQSWFALAPYAEAARQCAGRNVFEWAFEVLSVKMPDEGARLLGPEDMRALGMAWIERRPDGVDSGTIPTNAISDDGEFHAVCIEVPHWSGKVRPVVFVRDVQRPWYRGIPIQWPHLVRSSGKGMLDISWYEGYAFDPRTMVRIGPEQHALNAITRSDHQKGVDQLAFATGRGSTVDEAIDDLLSLVDEWIDEGAP